LLSQDSLQRAVEAAAIEARPRFLEEMPSTNSVALEMAEAGAPEWTVVAAGHQTAGRGRLGRSWASVPGRSLLLSVVLRPSVAPHQAPLLSLLAAAEMAAACPPVESGRVRTKWPNDLVAGDRKLGGILPEARMEGGRVRHVVLGIGVNVSMTEADFPEGLLATATSLSLEGASLEPEDLLGRFLTRFRGAYRPVDPDFADHVLARYQPTCATIGRIVSAKTVDGRTVRGTAATIDPDGGLVVEADGGREVVAFGEVAHLE
jgi:BirA family biotin operon repressor/biotin-[acetyl-CoA-carboxylase] ligase